MTDFTALLHDLGVKPSDEALSPTPFPENDEGEITPAALRAGLKIIVDAMGAAIPAAATKAEAEAGAESETRLFSPLAVAQAIAALAESGAAWSYGAAAPGGGADGDWYVRTGETSPGVYVRAAGSWVHVLAPGTADGGGAALSDASPLKAGTAEPGSSADASRADHVHPAELDAGAVSPAMLDAGTDEKQLAFREAIGVPAQQQSDWSQSDASAPDFVKDKPPLGSAAAKDAGAASGEVPLLGAGGKLAAGAIPDEFAKQSDVDDEFAALKGGVSAAFDTLAEIAAAIGLRLRQRGDYGSTDTYDALDVIRHTAPAAAHYVAIRAVPAGKAPGVAADWAAYWRRLGWEEGSPSSLTGTPTYDGDTLTLTDRSGADHEVVISSDALPGEIRLEDLAEVTDFVWSKNTVTIAGLYAKLPDDFVARVVGKGRDQDEMTTHGTVIDIGAVGSTAPTAVKFQIGGASDRVVRIYRSGDDIVISRDQASITLSRVLFAKMVAKGKQGEPGPPTGFVEIGAASWTISTANQYTVGGGGGITDATLQPGTVLGVVYGNAAFTPDMRLLFASQLPIRQAGGNAAGDDAMGRNFAGQSYRLARDANGRILVAVSSTTLAPAPLTLYRVGSAAAPAQSAHITGFSATSGELNPIATGSAQTLTYGLEWSIAQSSHLGAARIVSFIGTAANPTSVAVLHTLSESEYAHGDAQVSRSVNLNAGQIMTIRLEIYGPNDDPSTDLPRGYQDIRVTFHAPAAAKYRVLYVRYDASDADAAATIARISADPYYTSASRPATMTIQVPSDSNEYQICFEAEADAAQPAGFSNSGIDAGNTFYPVENHVVGSVTYKAYLLRPEFRVDSGSNGDEYGISYD